MPEIKIQCDCGQRYKFDVEPLNGRMPFTVNCPICGLDGTEKANQTLAQVLAASPVPVATALPVAAPAPPSARPTVRINKPTPEPAAAATTAPLDPASYQGRLQQAAAAAPGAPVRKPSFALGFLGAVIGALTGSLVYFLIFNYTGFRVKLLAIGVGYLAGLGAELLGRKEGSKELGVIAAVLTLVGIVSAQYVVARSWWQTDEGSKPEASAYQTSVTEAKQVMAAIPNGSDQEIRIYLAKEAADEDEKPDPASITDDDIKSFRETALPGLRDLASGKISKAEFDKKAEAEAARDKADVESEEGTFKAVFLLLLLSKVNLFSLAAAAGLAFKVCSNA